MARFRVGRNEIRFSCLTVEALPRGTRHVYCDRCGEPVAVLRPNVLWDYQEARVAKRAHRCRRLKRGGLGRVRAHALRVEV